MRLILAIFIAIVPSNYLRIFLYRTFFRYDISYKSKMRYLNLILCKKLVVRANAGFSGCLNIVRSVDLMIIEQNSYIGRLNRFNSIKKVHIEPDVIIRSSNCFFGTMSDISPFKEYESILIGEQSIITSKHLFDLSDTIEIGKDVTFGGCGTEVWTHGFDLKHIKKQGSVKIGNNSYIGSRTIILPGISICEGVSIGSGTIVSKDISVPGFYISSSLTRKGDAPSFEDAEDLIEKNNYYFLRK